ncbi:MAG: TOMM precursor leader peptide-binding protein, partial [Hamadaea sp.]|nr:TOMM precursor leader peptide-binding protein [Hamadaea sp.]
VGDRASGPRVRAARAGLRVEISAGRLPAPTSWPFLLVTVREAVITVGPLVVAEHGPCLGCLKRHRTDRDPQWAKIEEQLPDGPGEEPPCAAVTTLAAAARTIAEALAVVDGGPSALIGASVEISGADEIRRRRWERHPACRCPP